MKPQIPTIKFLLLLTAAFIAANIFGISVAKADTIYINTRNDLRNLPNAIDNAVLDGETEIDVVFAPKTFTYREGLLNFANKQWDDITLRLIGNGAKLVAEGPIIENKGKYKHTFQPTNTYITINGQTLSPWGELRSSDRQIEVIDEEKKLCRLHWTEAPDMLSKDCGDTWINISQWYTSAVHKVTRIDREWIYFTASNLTYNANYKCYNVNLDYGYGKMMPRFRLCNVKDAKITVASDSAQGMGEPTINISDSIISLPDSVSAARECTATHFLQMKNCTLESLTIQGLTFLGNKESNNYLLTLTSLRADSVTIRACSFIGLGSGAIYSQKTDNLTVTNCTFREGRRYGVLIIDGENPRITKNTFTRMGLALQNSFCIRVSATNFLVAQNTIRDFGYGAIAVGTWWASPKTSTVSGIVEQNLIYYSPLWMKNILGHSLMDSGAIYLYTQMDDVMVRQNFIHDYTGAHDNRGIFCDDGAKNFTIEGNVILNTPNSFSIDSRRTISIETNPHSHTEKVNINNSISENVIDGSIRFEGRDNNANCNLKRNIILRQKANSQQENVLANLSTATPFSNAAFHGISNGLVSVPSATLRLLRALPSWWYLRKYFITE